jgi:hypothetical protein
VARNAAENLVRLGVNVSLMMAIGAGLYGPTWNGWICLALTSEESD